MIPVIALFNILLCLGVLTSLHEYKTAPYQYKKEDRTKTQIVYFYGSVGIMLFWVLIWIINF